jgi:hypothetical protein
MENIYTFGNRVFRNGTPASEIASVPKPRRRSAERVNFKFGKIRVAVTGSKRVNVSQKDAVLTITME